MREFDKGFVRIKYSDTVAFATIWFGNYEERYGRSFVRIKLYIHYFQDYETC
jgi:hypothetical protein